MRYVLLMMLALLVSGCQSGTPKPPPVTILQCPPVALVGSQAEPAAPADAEMNDSARRWLFGELLPWGRGEAKGRDQTKRECEALGEGA